MGSALRATLRNRAREETGFSLVEMLIVVLLLTTAFLALAQVATTGLFTLRSAADRTTAMGFATQSVEAARTLSWEQLLVDQNLPGAGCGSLLAVDPSGGLDETVLCGTEGAVQGSIPFWWSDSRYGVETYVTGIAGYDNARRVTAIVRWDEGDEQRELRTSTVVAEVGRD